MIRLAWLCVIDPVLHGFRRLIDPNLTQVFWVNLAWQWITPERVGRVSGRPECRFRQGIPYSIVTRVIRPKRE